MGYKPRPLLFVINPKAHKNQIVFQVQNFLFHQVTQVTIWVTITNSSQVPKYYSHEICGFGRNYVWQKFLCSCQYI